MKNKHDTKVVLFFFLSMFFANHLLAGIMAENTRVIFPEGVNEKTIMIANTNPYPILVQTWIDNGDIDNTPEKTNSPFIVLPAVFRMMPHEVKGLRIIYKNQPLPGNQESLFWLNLYEIPPKTDAVSNKDAELLVAMNTQMKVFYRPKALKQDNHLSDHLQFTLLKKEDGFILSCVNSTGFYASFSSIKLIIDKKEYKPESKLDMMVAPKSTEQFIFKNINTIGKKQPINLEYMLINDMGLSEKGMHSNIFEGAE